MKEYELRFEVWPFFSIPQEQAGERQQAYVFRADSFDDACELARVYIAGVKANPAVWQAPIISVAKINS
jgi:hypothetical protein